MFFYIALNGHGFQFFWQEYTFFQNYNIPLTIAISWVLVIEFTIRFLDLKNKYKNYYSLFRVLQIITISLLPFLFYSLQFVNKIHSLLGLINSISLFAIGILSWKKGNKAARFFVIAWGTFLVGIILIISKSLGLLGTNFFTNYLMQIGSTLELIFLSLALVDKYKSILDENIKVQKELLEFQIKQTQTLEEKVELRTSELKNTLKVIRSDLSIAKKIQENTLILNHKVIEDLEIIPIYMAMSEVGGDFYAVDKIGDSKYRIFMADATGHGVQAALVTMAIKGLYDNIKLFQGNPDQIINLFNDEFYDRYISLNAFLTCILVDIDVKNFKLYYASAGHPAGVLLKEESLILLEKTGKLIGIEKENNYGLVEYDFALKDRLILFTDGAFEEFNFENEEFGEHRLHAILKQTRNLSTDKSIKEILFQLDSFLGSKERQDDITILGINHKKSHQ